MRLNKKNVNWEYGKPLKASIGCEIYPIEILTFEDEIRAVATRDMTREAGKTVFLRYDRCGNLNSFWNQEDKGPIGHRKQKIRFEIRYAMAANPLTTFDEKFIEDMRIKQDPITKDYWINVFPESLSETDGRLAISKTLYTTKEAADAAVKKSERVNCIKITLEGDPESC